MNTHLFHPYKTIGQISSPIPPQVLISQTPQSSRVYTCLSHTFHTYSLPYLTMVGTGPRFPNMVSNICVIRFENINDDIVDDIVFACVGSDIFVVSKGEVLCVLREHNVKVKYLLKIGFFVLSIDTKNQYVLWNSKVIQENKKNINYNRNTKGLILFKNKFPNDLQINCLLHPVTYLDKILVGTFDGYIDVFNIRFGKRIHRFDFRKNLLGKSEEEEADSTLQQSQRKELNIQVTAMENSTILDVVGFGFSNGCILVHNIKKSGPSLRRFQHTPGSVTSLSFHVNLPYLISGGSTGTVAVWNLEKQKLIHLLQPHTAKVTALQFSPYDAYFFSSAEDNTIILYDFEKPEHAIPIRNSLSGHSKPINRIRFYGPQGSWVISSSYDQQIRQTHLQSGRSIPFSQKQARGNLAGGEKSKKMNNNRVTSTNLQQVTLPSPLDFDISYLRQDDWENLASIHQGQSIVRTWMVKNRSIGPRNIYVPSSYGTATCLCLGPEGHFVLIGRSTGRVEKWNIQSHQFKHTFNREKKKKKKEDRMGDEDDDEEEEEEEAKDAHDGCVTGVAIDCYRRCAVSIGYDKYIRFWNFMSGKLEKEILTDVPLGRMRMSSSGRNLVALSGDDFVVRVIDLELLRIVRVFKGHKSKVNDMCFSEDQRILVTCGMDGYLISWDIVGGYPIEWMEVKSPAVTIDWHPQGLYLATAHLDRVGICLWFNQSVFKGEGEVSVRPVREARKVSLPECGEVIELLLQSNNEIDDDEEEEEDGDEDEEEGEDDDDEDEDEDNDLIEESQNWLSFPSSKCREIAESGTGASMTVLSDVPSHKLRALPYLDLIRARNRPVKRKRKEDAPFFLPTLPTLDRKRGMKFVGEDEEEEENDDDEEEEILETNVVDEEDENKEHEKVRDEDEDVEEGIGGIFNFEGDQEEDEEEEENENNISFDEKKEEEEEEETFFLDGPSGTLMSFILEKEPHQHNNYIKGMEYLKQLTNKDIDVEIRSLSTYHKLKELKCFLRFLLWFLETGKEFDFVQATLNLFLKAHGEVIMAAGGENSASDELFKIVALLKARQKERWGNIEQLLMFNECVVRMLALMD